MNLELDMEEVSRALEGSFDTMYGGGRSVRWSEAEMDETLFEPLLERQYSDEWRYGHTPRFTFKHEESVIEVEHGRVVRAGKQHAPWQGRPFNEIAELLMRE